MPDDARASMPDDPTPGRPAICACRDGGGTPEGASWETRMLVEHAELAMRLSRQVVRQAEEANWLGPNGDLMFARISHAMQVSIALKAKLEAEADRRAKRDAAAEAGRAAEGRQARERQKAMVRQLVETAIETAAETGGNPAGAARLRLDLEVRLGALDIARELEGRSFGEIVAGVCRELGITPDVAPFAPALTPALSRSAGEGAQDGGVGSTEAAQDGGAAAGDRYAAVAALATANRASFDHVAETPRPRCRGAGHDPP